MSSDKSSNKNAFSLNNIDNAYKSIQSIKKTNKEIIECCIHNVILMLKNRGIINFDTKDDLKNYAENLIKQHKTTTDENIYVLKNVKTNDNKTYIIRFINDKSDIDKLVKKSAGDETIMNEKLYNNILIIDKDIMTDNNQKSLNNISSSEVFSNADFQFDIISHVHQPKFQLLTKEEQKEVLKSYNVDKKSMKIMYEKIDSVAKYYNLKKGTIIKIIRPSENTSESVDYRIVK